MAGESLVAWFEQKDREALWLSVVLPAAAGPEPLSSPGPWRRRPRWLPRLVALEVVAEQHVPLRLHSPYRAQPARGDDG